MPYQVKMQKVERPTNRSYYINFPAALADALEVSKGEAFEWRVEDRNTFVPRRVKEKKSFLNKELPTQS